jgi:hypothetical protein
MKDKKKLLVKTLKLMIENKLTEMRMRDYYKKKYNFDPFPKIKNR